MRIQNTAHQPFLQQQSLTLYVLIVHLYNYITLFPHYKYCTTTIFTAAKFHHLHLYKLYYTSPPLHNNHFYSSKVSLSTPVQLYYTYPPSMYHDRCKVRQKLFYVEGWFYIAKLFLLPTLFCVVY